MTSKDPRATREAQRQRRLDGALRENLKKRKALARERTNSGGLATGDEADRTGATGAGALGGDKHDVVE